jgi:hypothetical protein
MNHTRVKKGTLCTKFIKTPTIALGFTDATQLAETHWWPLCDKITSIGLLTHFTHLINARNTKHIKQMNYNLRMSLRDDDVNTLVVSHSYRSTCLSNSAVGEKGRITYCRLYLWIQSARSIVCVLASIFLHQTSRLPCVCVPACVHWDGDFKMPTAVRKKRYGIFSAWIWPPHSTDDLQVRIDITRIEWILQYTYCYNSGFLIKLMNEATSHRK